MMRFHTLGTLSHSANLEASARPKQQAPIKNHIRKKAVPEPAKNTFTPYSAQPMAKMVQIITAACLFFVFKANASSACNIYSFGTSVSGILFLFRLSSLYTIYYFPLCFNKKYPAATVSVTAGYLILRQITARSPDIPLSCARYTVRLRPRRRWRSRTGLQGT